MMVVRDPDVSESALLRKRPFFRRRDFQLMVLAALIYIIFYNNVEDWMLQTVWGIITVICCVLINLNMVWSVTFRCKMQFDTLSIADIDQAEFVLCIPPEHCGSPALCPLKFSSNEGVTFRFFLFQQLKYVYSAADNLFVSPELPISLPLQHYHSSNGLSSRKENENARIFGDNLFDIPLPEFGDLFQEHAFAPFFVFQMFCVALWMLDEYWYYAVLTLVMLVIFECTVINRRLANLKNLRAMRVPPHEVLVHRAEKWMKIKSDKLLPGDLISLVSHSKDEVTPCDMLLLSGSVVVNESMLTGESMPILKEALDGKLDGSTPALDMMGVHQSHVVFGGTRVLLHTPPKQYASNSRSIRLDPVNNGCLGYVLRTGFQSGQGKLVRTILFSTERMTANNREALLFIIILLVFAIAASGYVLVQGMKDESRDKWKLMLNCIMICTSVVPPELPMELSIAVNTSVIALRKGQIFCTEPFRIPFGGAVDICCFDKTGTLTSGDFKVLGVSGVVPKEAIDAGSEDGDENTPATALRQRPRKSLLSPEAKPKSKLQSSAKPTLGALPVGDLTPANSLPDDVALVLASCHSLQDMKGELVGDPLEKAALEAINWQLRENYVSEKNAKAEGAKRIKILQRFAFSSALKRMSTIVCLTHSPSQELRVMTKGSPEELKSRFASLPDNYDQLYTHFARMGHRVLALGWRPVSAADQNSRELVETGLHFAGFIVSSCPIKPGTLDVICELRESSHAVMMITGDHALTACHVAKEVKICTKPVLVLACNPHTSQFTWESTVSDSVSIPSEAFPFASSAAEACLTDLCRRFDLCVCGPELERLVAAAGSQSAQLLMQLVPYVQVFARTSPGQKESIVVALKGCGVHVLMCGDGTNDVGALKQAHVGIALLTPVEDELKRDRKEKKIAAKSLPNQLTLKERMRLLEEEASSTNVKLGDASIASPFTSKVSHIHSALTIIRQGRCTLVTTLQMFHILGVNCLVSAYSMSALYLDGVKFGDTQMFITSIFIAMFFLFLSQSKPIDRLSTERPHPQLFSWYTLFTIAGQFVIHLVVLLAAVQLASSQKRDDTDKKSDSEFKPNVMNSVVYLISTSSMCVSFICNYRGLPFMESLSQNKRLKNALGVVWGLMFLCASVH